MYSIYMNMMKMIVIVVIVKYFEYMVMIYINNFILYKCYDKYVYDV